MQQGITINKTFNEFKEKYEAKVVVLEKEFQKQHLELVTEMDAGFEKLYQRADKVEKMIIKEREDRIREAEENLKPIRANIVCKEFLKISLIL